MVGLAGQHPMRYDLLPHRLESRDDSGECAGVMAMKLDINRMWP